MSTVTTKVAPPLMTEVKKKRVRPYKARVSTKVKWALGDAMDKTIEAQRRMRNVLAWLEEMRAFTDLDVRVVAQLGRLDHELFGLALDVSEMERILAGAVAESKPEKPKSKYSEL